MAAPATQTTSKSAKKKGAAQAIERAESPAPSTASGALDKNAEDDAFQSPYIKELQKNIRNINKKIANASKTDTLLSEHKGKSLDELVATKVINADQKAQILKKPALQAQLNQNEEMLTQYLKVDEQYRARAATDKAETDKTVQAAKESAVAEAKEGFEKTQRANLLLLSQFLRLAAYRREEAQDPESDESQAIEGVLLAIYTGDEGAVNAMLKLVEGAEESILSVPGEQLQTTYSAVKTLAQNYKTPFYAEGAEAPETTPAQQVATDPTIAHATANELEAGDVPAINGQAVEAVADKLANSHVADDAANAVAESHWDTGNDMSISQEWVDVKVPRDPAETETGVTATPAAPSNTQSWADDHPEPAAEVPASAVPAAQPTDDGFHQVQRNKGRSDREGGNYRGRGRGDWRGRGRGDGRGRGRGNRGGQRGAPRRSDES